MTEAVDVDESLSIDELRDLALRFRDFSPDDDLFSTVPVSDPAERRDHRLEALEVDLHVVVDAHPGQLLQGADEQRRPAGRSMPESFSLAGAGRHTSTPSSLLTMAWKPSKSICM